MRDIEQTIEHAGLKIEIYPDNDPQRPDDWGDDRMFLVGFHEREFFVERKGFDKELCNALMGSTDEPEHHDKDVLDLDVRDTLKKYHVFGLEAYIHSGVALYLSGECKIDRQWDVSQVGCVFIAKTECRTRPSARKAAESLIETWNQYLSGDVHGYVVKDADGGDLDSLDESCWGFYGIESAIEAGKEAAEYLAKNIKQKREAKLKTLIANHVPLDRRAALIA